MKFLFESLMFFMVLMNLGCSFNQKDTFDINIDFLEKISHDTFKIDIELNNKSDTTVKYWLMTCSWEENFLLSTNEISLVYKECPKNSPYLHSLSPGEKMILKGKLKVTKSNKDEKFKLGLVLIKENEYSIQHDYKNILEMKINLHQDIIWSKPRRYPL